MMNYWNFAAITKWVSERVSGDRLPSMTAGLHRRLKRIGPFERAFSLVSKAPSREIELVKDECVGSFDCFLREGVSTNTLGRQLLERDLEGRVQLAGEEPFESVTEAQYDLVYWNSTLHQIEDVERAIAWSHDVLRPGGVFVMQEYTGPARNQWTERNLELVNAFRRELAQEFEFKPVELSRPDPEALARKSPNKAARSDRILPALKARFEVPEIIPLGGAYYVFGLAGLWPHLAKRSDLVDRVLDLETRALDESLLSFAIAMKM